MGFSEKDEATAVGKKRLRPRAGSRRKKIVMAQGGQRLTKGKKFSRGKLEVYVADLGRIDGDDRPSSPAPGKSTGGIEVGELVPPPRGCHRQVLDRHPDAFPEAGMGTGGRDSADIGVPSHKETQARSHGEYAQSTVKVFR